MQTVADRMTADPICVQPGSTLRYCLRLMVSHGVRHLPVVDIRRRLLGILYDFQVLRHCERRGAVFVPRPEHADRPAMSLAVAAGRTARPGQPVSALLGLLSESWEDAVVVLDGDRRPVGLFTLREAMDLAADWLAPWWTVEEVMSPIGAVLPAAMPVRRALAALWRDHRASALVADGKRVVGLASLPELLAVDPDAEVAVGEVLPAGRLPVIASTTPLILAARALRDRKLGALPVVDDGRPRGLLTNVALFRAVGRNLLIAEAAAS